jgi:hypothetical protein
MRRVLSVIALSVAVAVAPSGARAQREHQPEFFNSEFLRDPGGDRFAIGEDVLVNERLRAGELLAGELAILEPHPTKRRPGAGVAFNIYDAKDDRVFRIFFVDVPGEGTLRFGGWAAHSQRTGPAKIVTRHLSAQRGDTVGFRLRLNKANQLYVSVEAETMAVDLGFTPAGIEVEIFCGKSVVRFGDFPSVS